MEKQVKAGTVITVWVDLRAITAPIVISSRKIPGAHMLPAGNGAEQALGVMMKSYGSGGGAGGKGR